MFGGGSSWEDFRAPTTAGATSSSNDDDHARGVVAEFDKDRLSGCIEVAAAADHQTAASSTERRVTFQYAAVLPVEPGLDAAGVGSTAKPSSKSTAPRAIGVEDDDDDTPTDSSPAAPPRKSANHHQDDDGETAARPSIGVGDEVEFRLSREFDPIAGRVVAVAERVRIVKKYRPPPPKPPTAIDFMELPSERTPAAAPTSARGRPTTTAAAEPSTTSVPLLPHPSHAPRPADSPSGAQAVPPTAARSPAGVEASAGSFIVTTSSGPVQPKPAPTLSESKEMARPFYHSSNEVLREDQLDDLEFHTHHRRLVGKVDFYPFPSDDEITADALPPTPGSDVPRVRIFLGQMPYTISEKRLSWLVMTFASKAVVEKPDRIMKRMPRGDKLPTGCFHAEATSPHLVEMVRRMHKRMLVEDAGVWYASDDTQQLDILRDYTLRMKNDRTQRVQGLPYDTVVIQEATSATNHSHGGGAGVQHSSSQPGPGMFVGKDMGMFYSGSSPGAVDPATASFHHHQHHHNRGSFARQQHHHQQQQASAWSGMGTPAQTW